MGLGQTSVGAGYEVGGLIRGVAGAVGGAGAVPEEGVCHGAVHCWVRLLLALRNTEQAIQKCKSPAVVQ